jgi:hypothetical protein
MIIYNLTIKVDEEISQDWLSWLQYEHIPEVMATKCFHEYQLSKLLDDDTPGDTFVVQYFADSIEQYQLYISRHAEALRQKNIDKWGDRFLSFRTVMEVIQ